MTALDKAIAAREQAAFDVVVAAKGVRSVHVLPAEAERMLGLLLALAAYDAADLAVTNELIP